ncbi:MULTISPECIES: dipeptide ABC transporter ATP-binding protein [unclassified Pseudovibrio]|uniref:ABC transporter ATP-binding protein n=1 Tax=unclassified Pseudovibrio TaxID=2627060 RepID=UPI000710499D|nr:MULTISPECIES: dipeptide ABC transporter ATP-binding protein [unclassified Pseudovibrio]KZK92082.1 Glutathione import ATP-binding protein GsiA [Pseudovibrio sp. Ad5]KZK94993.1 Glutathione import ATP-binding protein GsiA [Pseudovibrio sp. W74]KZL08796.1 Glutathione import ATP-binding protein GsiA [Pseudovibrio sp. Ad14]
MTSVFSATDLCVSISGKPILRNVSFDLEQGKILGLVGESGSGKSMSALSAMQLLPEGAHQIGDLMFEGKNLTRATDTEMTHVRGKDISMVFQEPLTALNPTRTIGEQVAEGLRWHQGLTRKEAMDQTIDVLERVGLGLEYGLIDRFPHQLSGGQRQRVVIAIAIACKPKVLIADEPTTALDVTVQAQILTLLKDIVRKEQMAMLLISHDLAVVADMADTVAIMKDGVIVERGPTCELFDNLSHPYSKKLFEASNHVPVPRQEPVDEVTQPLLKVSNVLREYPLPRASIFTRRQWHRAVQHVSFHVAPRQSMGLVGESGCGKSTLARTILGLTPPNAGHIQFLGKDPYSVSRKDRQDLQLGIQAVFQDPYGSFDPRHTVERTVGEPLHLMRNELSRSQRKKRVHEVLESVGLSSADANKYPHEFSGGQRQRIAIARALVTNPSLIVADEPVSALDVSIRAQILDLFADLRDRLGMAYLFISHDLSVVQAITDRVIVMNAGRIVEEGPTGEVFSNPKHPYTRILVSAAPDLNEALRRRREKENKDTH